MASKKRSVSKNKNRVAYVVMEQGFEYDDQYYRSGEGGRSRGIYLDKEAANEAAEALTETAFVKLLGLGIQSYVGEGNNFFSNPSDELKELFKKVFKQDYDEFNESYDVELVFEGTNEELKIIIAACNIPNLYYVEEAEINHPLS